jgi:hypothetical protein
MRTFVKLGVLAGMVLGLAAGCASVKRLDTDTVTDLSGYWNDTDARLVAEEMITDCLKRPWLNDFAAKAGRKPAVIVGTVVNRSDEHIATQTFIRDMERELINNGQVKFVAGKGEREEVREEREDQQTNASAETLKKMRNERGADFMLKGEISTIVDTAGGKTVRFYHVDLKLIDLETSDQVWLGTKEIKKQIDRGMLRG